jgi:hypothetical protein
MKTGMIIGFLIFLCGAVMLWSDGGFSPTGNSADSAVIRALTGMQHHWVMPPALGWFVAGTGAVLLGLKFQEKKRAR